MTQFASTLYPQTNPTNPILLKVRNMHPNHRELWVETFLAFPKPQRCVWPDWSMAHWAHARRVLTRLAAFTG